MKPILNEKIKHENIYISSKLHLGTKKPELFSLIYSWEVEKQTSKAGFLCSYLEPGKLEMMEDVKIQSQALKD